MPFPRATGRGSALATLAVSLFLALSARAGDSAAEAYREGSQALAARDYERAIGALERVVELEPESTEAWFKLGLARSGAGDREGAIEAYARTIELDPRHVKALNNMGNVYFRQGLYDEARTWYRRALDLDPDYLLANYHYGWILRQFNETQEAERVFRHCLEIRPDDDTQRRTQLDCLFYLGTLRFRSGDDAQTASMMEQVLAAFPGHPEARYYLGMAYRNLGRLDEAQEQLAIHEKMLAARRRDPIGKREDP